MRWNNRDNGTLGITPQQPSREILYPLNPSSHLASWESHASSSPAGKISRLHALLRTICLRITTEIHSHMKLQILHFAVYVVVTVIRKVNVSIEMCFPYDQILIRQFKRIALFFSAAGIG